MNALLQARALEPGKAPMTLSSWWKNAFLLTAVILAITGDHAPFSPLTKFATSPGSHQACLLGPGLSPSDHLTANFEGAPLPQLIAMYGDLTGRTPRPSDWRESLNDLSGGYLAKWRFINLPQSRSSLIIHGDGRWRADELKQALETILQTNGVTVLPHGEKHYRIVRSKPAPSSAF